MIQGTAPIDTFRIPFDTALIKEVRVLYAQDDRLVLKKTTDDCILDGDTIQVQLTQEDTFMFDYNKPIEYQVRLLTVAGEPLASVPKKIGVTKCLDDEVLV